MNSTPSQIPTPPVVCLGELLVDLIADKPGRLSEVSSFQKCPGGAPANVAVGIARLGTPCGFIGKVGADVFGKFLV
ncbi:MAG: PfkB family carbohydrate kinase, partial [Candidatus Hermodarchaeota archaeon]|nr:PfkB family carbohydrate kinase [Candidatus Hermodarchaeota archaeon]